MFNLLMVMVLLIVDDGYGKNGFENIGISTSSSYYLSNPNDKRSVANSRVGCSDAFQRGQLVALETHEEEEEVKRWLTDWGIKPDDRVWTTGEHDGTTWVWYDYYKGTSTEIDNPCEGHEWSNNVCPTGGCLAIGGWDLTYTWQNDSCSAKRRYLCEYPEPEEYHI